MSLNFASGNTEFFADQATTHLDFRSICAVVRSLAEPVIVFEPDGLAVCWSEPTLSLTNLSSDQLGRKRFNELLLVYDPFGKPVGIQSVVEFVGTELLGKLHSYGGASGAVLVIPSRLVDCEGNFHILCSIRLVPPSLRQQQIINQISSEVISIKPLEQVLKIVTRLMVELTQVDHATITLLDKRESYFEILCEHPERHPPLIGTRIPVTGMPTQIALIEHRQPIIAHTVEQHSIYQESKDIQALVNQVGIKSMLIIPMAFKDRVVGTISVDSFGGRKQFTGPEMAMYESIANLAVVAIQNARLFEESRILTQQSLALQKLHFESSTAQGLESLAETILIRLGQIVESHKSSLQLIKGEQRSHLGAHGFSPKSASPWLMRPVSEDALISRVLASRTITVIADTTDKSAAPDWDKSEGTTDVNSWVGIPLFCDDIAIGLVTLDHSKAGFYGDLPQETLRLLKQFAEQAAVDIRNALRYEAARHEVKAFAFLKRVSELSNGTLNATEMLRGLAREIAATFQCDQVHVYLRERLNTRWVLARKASWPRQIVVRTHLECDDVFDSTNELPLVMQAYRNGKTVPDEGHFEQTASCHDMPEDSAACAIAVPINIADDQTIGVIEAIDCGRGRFTYSDRLLLETLTLSTASAILRATGLELVHTVGRDILRAVKVDDVLQQIVLGAINLTHMDTGVIYLLSADGRSVTNTFHPLGFVHPRPRLEMETGITRQIVLNQKMVVIPDVNDDHRVNPELRRRYGSMVGIPLVLDKSVVGVLYLNGKEQRGLTAIETSFLRTLADQAAIVIERTSLYQRIRDSEAEYCSLLDNIPHSVFRKDRQSRFVSANAAFRKSLGINNIAGHIDSDFYEPALAKKYVDDDQKVMQMGTPMPPMDEMHRAPGMQKAIWVRVVKTPVRDANNNITGVQAIFWDVTEEKLAGERYRSLVEQSPDAIVVHTDGMITMANPAALRMFGATEEMSLLNRPILDLVHESSKPLAQERLQKLLRKQDVERVVEMTLQRLDGKTVVVEVHGRPAPGDSEIQVVFHDLTRVNTILSDKHHRVSRALNEVARFLDTKQGFLNRPEIIAVFKATQLRIIATARVHEMLIGKSSDALVNMDDFLGKLVTGVYEAYGCDPTQIRWTVDAQGIGLGDRPATHCGLIVTELVTNSLVHGFKTKAEGQVCVAMRRESGDQIQLSVTDTGSAGGKATSLPRAGAGLTLVRRLVEDDLDGQMEISRKRGYTVTLRFNSQKATEEIS